MFEYVSFNPRAPCGARQRASHIELEASVFQSTRPMRGATSRIREFPHLQLFQSTRPMRGATNSSAQSRA